MVYSDAIAAHGFAHELANYGEYSGAPMEGQSYVLRVTRKRSSICSPPWHAHPEGEILIIGGGIVNFTNVTATSKGIIRTLKELAPLIAHNVIYSPVPVLTEVYSSILPLGTNLRPSRWPELSGRPEGDAPAWRIARCSYRSLWPCHAHHRDHSHRSRREDRSQIWHQQRAFHPAFRSWYPTVRLGSCSGR